MLNRNEIRKVSNYFKINYIVPKIPNDNNENKTRFILCQVSIENNITIELEKRSLLIKYRYLFV